MSSLGRAALVAAFVRVVMGASGVFSQGRIWAGWCWGSLVAVGDEKLLGREQGDYPAAIFGDHQLLLDPCRGPPIGCRAIRFEREDHPLLNFHRVVEGDEPADDRPLVKGEPEPVAKLEREGFHFAGEAELRGLGPAGGDLVGGYPWLDQSARRVPS